MGKDSAVTLAMRVEEESRPALDEVLREGARRMLQAAIEAEAADYIQQHVQLREQKTARRLVVRNGYQQERTIQSALGDIPVLKPRVHDRMLYYWIVDHGDDPEDVASNTAQLLQIANANGNCLAWVDIFHQALLVNNVTVFPVQVLPDVGVGIVGGHNPEFIVRKVGWDDEEPDFPGSSPWVYGDNDVFIDEAGIPGQNTRTPARKIFEYHFVTRRVIAVNPETNIYYDPAYGITAESESDYTEKAIVGWGRWFPFDGAYHYRKITGTEHIQFNHNIDW